MSDYAKDVDALIKGISDEDTKREVTELLKEAEADSKTSDEHADRAKEALRTAKQRLESG